MSGLNHRRDCLESWLRLLPRLERAIADGDTEELQGLLELRSELLKLLQTLEPVDGRDEDWSVIEELARRIREQEAAVLATCKQEMTSLSGEIRKTRRSRDAAGNIRDLGSGCRQGRLVDNYQ